MHQSTYVGEGCTHKAKSNTLFFSIYIYIYVREIFIFHPEGSVCYNKIMIENHQNTWDGLWNQASGNC